MFASIASALRRLFTLHIKEQLVMSTSIDHLIEQHEGFTDYIKEVYPKLQLYLHWTLSSDNVKSVIGHFAKVRDNISTPYIIDRDGIIHQLFDPKYYAFHLGVTQGIFRSMGVTGMTSRKLHKHSIAIELTNFGPLEKKGDKFYSIYGNLVPSEQVVEVDNLPPYRYFQDYTPKQLNSTKLLLQKLGADFNIPLDYRPDMWDLSKDALSGKPGVFTHLSVRKGHGKWDCHPTDELIATLKSLKG